MHSIIWHRSDRAHSIVISASVADHLDAVGEVGGVIGVSISASFLLLLAIINSIILYRTLKARRRRPDEVAPVSGCLFRLINPLFRAIDQPWRLYLVGLLFGLGFDTASEIALLGVSAEAGTATSRPSDILILPLLFAAGMTLVDSVNSVAMLWSYAAPDGESSGWRDRRFLEAPIQEELDKSSVEDAPLDLQAPERPLPAGISSLSIVLTILSIAMAFTISLIEFMGLAATQCASCAEAAENDDGLSGRWWRFWLACNDNCARARRLNVCR
jgi:high-affinity nickel-transport protein